MPHSGEPKPTPIQAPLAIPGGLPPVQPLPLSEWHVLKDDGVGGPSSFEALLTVPESLRSHWELIWKGVRPSALHIFHPSVLTSKDGATAGRIPAAFQEQSVLDFYAAIERACPDADLSVALSLIRAGNRLRQKYSDWEDTRYSPPNDIQARQEEFVRDLTAVREMQKTALLLSPRLSIVFLFSEERSATSSLPANAFSGLFDCLVGPKSLISPKDQFSLLDVYLKRHPRDARAILQKSFVHFDCGEFGRFLRLAFKSFQMNSDAWRDDLPFVTSWRRRGFFDDFYAGIEYESSQKYCKKSENRLLRTLEHFLEARPDNSVARLIHTVLVYHAGSLHRGNKWCAAEMSKIIDYGHANIVFTVFWGLTQQLGQRVLEQLRICQPESSEVRELEQWCHERWEAR